VEEEILGRFHQHFTRSFYAQKSQKRKKNQLNRHCLFVLLVSTRAKAVHEMLVKLTPGVNFTNILYVCFFVQKCFGTFAKAKM